MKPILTHQLFICFFIYILVSVRFAYSENMRLEHRVSEIEKKSSQVMPFDLTETVHYFLKNNSGGTQQVIAKNATDTNQIHLIRHHLKQISQQFSQGNYSAPAKIHGKTMPGLLTLKQADKNQISIEYKKINTGAEIRYSSREPNIILAIHQWFDAQLTDHAHHAVSGQHENIGKH